MKLRGYLRGLGAGIFISAVLMGIATSGNKTMTDEEVRKRAAALGMVDEDSVLVKPKIEETIPELPASQDSTDTSGVSKGDKEVKTADNGTEDKAEDKTEGKAENKTEETKVKENNTNDNKNEDNKSEDDQSDDNKTSENMTAEEIRAKEDRAMGGQNDTAANAGSADAEAKHEETKPAETKTEAKDDTKADAKPQDPAEGDNFTLQIASGATSYDVAKLLQKGGAIKDAADFDNYLCDKHLDNKINHGVFKIPVGAGYEEIAGIITGKR